MSPKIYTSIPDATLIGSILFAYFLDQVLPVIEIIPSLFNLVGWVVVATGLGLAIYTLSMLKSKHTSSDPGGVPSTLITTGVYSLSRNPIYLAFVITTSGAAIIFGSITAFIAPVICAPAGISDTLIRPVRSVTFAGQRIQRSSPSPGTRD